MENYQVEERSGVLLVTGTKPDYKTEFIGYHDLFSDEGGAAGGPPKHLFKGESVFFRKLRFLAEGKKKQVVYFTQGNGELDLNNYSATKEDEGMGQLREVLEQNANVEVKELRFDLQTEKVPDDATIILIEVGADQVILKIHFQTRK